MDKIEIQELVTALLVMVVGGMWLGVLGWDTCGLVVGKEVLECTE